MLKDRYLQIVIDQQVEIKAALTLPDLVDRTAVEPLQLLIEKSPVKVIMGIRRSGKSTLALQVLQKKQFIYFNFDDELLAQLSVEDINELFEAARNKFPNATYFLFDEIQNITGWEFFINKLHRKKVNILITGSNSRLLSSELATHLTGRHFGFELFPFSFTEFLNAQKIHFKNLELLTTSDRLLLKDQFMQYLNKGGFPETLNEDSNSQFSKMYLRELYDKIITRDLVQRRHIKNIKALKEISLLLFSSYSSQFTYNSVKNASSINSINTIKNYIDYLQESYLGFVVEPFSYKVKTRISLPKKFYLIDLSLVNAILGSSSPDLGKKLENLVFLHLRRASKEVYYVKQPSYEIDFLIREGRVTSELIQVAWSLADPKTRARELKALIHGAAEFKCTHLTVITLDEEELIQLSGCKIRVLPAWKWMLNPQTGTLTNEAARIGRTKPLR